MQVWPSHLWTRLSHLVDFPEPPVTTIPLVRERGRGPGAKELRVARSVPVMTGSQDRSYVTKEAIGGEARGGTFLKHLPGNTV